MRAKNIIKFLVLSLPIFVFSLSLSLIWDVFISAILLVGIILLIYKMPVDEYRFTFKLRNPIALIGLTALLSVIFFFRWLPSGKVAQIAEVLHIPNVLFLMLVTFIGGGILLYCLNYFFIIINDYNDRLLDKEQSSTSRSNSKLKALQIVRFIAFMDVFGCHVPIPIWGNGVTGVSLFFVLSGFLMTYNYYGKSKEKNLPTSIPQSIQFGYRKIAKLYPLHLIITFILLIILFITGWNTIPWKETIIRLTTQILLVQTWIPIHDYFFSFNGLTWYLATCLFAYCCFPLIIRIIEKYKSQKPAIIIPCVAYLGLIILGVVVDKIYPDNVDYISYYTMYLCPLTRIWDFVIGCNIGFLFIKRMEIKKEFASFLEVISLVFLFIGYKVCQVFPDIIPYWSTLSLINLPISVIIIYVFANGKGIISNLLQNNKIVTFIAEMSGFAYLIHQTIIRLGKVIFNKLSINYLWLIIVSFIVTIALSYLYSILLKKFTNRRKIK